MMFVELPKQTNRKNYIRGSNNTIYSICQQDEYT